MEHVPVSSSTPVPRRIAQGASSRREEPVRPYAHVHLFDGTSMRRHEPRDENTSLDHVPSSIQPEVFLLEDDYRMFHLPQHLPIFFAHGSFPSDLRVDLWRLRHAENEPDLRYYGEGEVDAHECIILRTPPTNDRIGSFDEYWLDLGRASAVLRWQHFRSGRLFCAADIQYQETAQGWLPEAWSYALYRRDGDGERVYTSFSFRVTKLVLDEPVADADFTVEPVSGTGGARHRVRRMVPRR